ncbi:MAG: MmgE/PrpD family protein, partial [Desulfomonilaceae bacterium]
MTLVDQMASFVVRSSYDDISEGARQDLKIRVLDSLGCAIGALDEDTVKLISSQVQDFGGSPLCTLIGSGKTAPDRAALFNSTLVRYLDFNDSYLARHETCHPSDNMGSVLAAAEYADTSGRELLTALAVAYQVQCRLSDVAPVRAKGFDHTTQGAYAVAAGVARALRLDETKTANAIAISGTAFNSLRVTRTGTLSNWKGLAYPNTAFGATHATFLAMRGVTGPPEVFEGNKGFMDAIAGRFEINWSRENMERVRQTIVKKFNAEIHSQAAIEGVLALKHEHGFRASEVEKIKIEIFDVAYHIIGGGEEGDKTVVRTKEQADHSLHYIPTTLLMLHEGPQASISFYVTSGLDGFGSVSSLPVRLAFPAF